MTHFTTVLGQITGGQSILEGSACSAVLNCWAAISGSPAWNLFILAASFLILTYAADYLVDGAVGVAVEFDVPKMIIGIVLVGFGTTMPEFIVSVFAALKGQPEIALGNALGSVIADDGLALALAILAAPKVIRVPSRLLKTTGAFLIAISFVSFGLSFTGYISRGAGLVLLTILVCYVSVLLISEKRRRAKPDKLTEKEDGEVADHIKPGGPGRQLLRFAVGLTGVIFASRALVGAAIFLANYFGVPSMIVGLTIVALGTSLPEVATCIAAARKGHGDLAFGDIIGADILNLLWIVGAAAVARPIVVDQRDVFFNFPAMLAFVVAKLVLAGIGRKLDRWKGIVLLVMYFTYLLLLGAGQMGLIAFLAPK